MLSFKSTLEKIEQSRAFENFKKQHENVELCAGFFVLDKESSKGEEKNQIQLDYLVDDDIYTFILNDEITIKKAEQIQGQKQKIQKLNLDNIKIDLQDIEKIIGEEFEKRNVNKKITKIIAIIQKPQNMEEIWNLTCMVQGMEIIRIHLDAGSGIIKKFEKVNMFDFIKKQ